MHCLIATTALFACDTMWYRTFKNLLYASRPVFNHFNLLRETYHCVTHRRGVPCVRDRVVLRSVTNRLKTDSKALSTFAEFNFHPDDIQVVFEKYLGRVETMIGNEVARQVMESMRLENINKLGSLRVLKGKKGREEVGKVEVDSSKGGDSTVGRKGGGSKKKRKRRKKRNW